MDKISNNVKRQVVREANLLKKYATQEELDRLNFERLEPFSGYGCIYGQMTGDCYGDRATELIKKCAVPVGGRISRSYGSLVNPVTKWVKRAWDRIYSGSSRRGSDMHTAIEYYITQPKANNKGLIDYLKGKRKVLNI